MNNPLDPLRAALRENETVVLEAHVRTHVGFFAGIHTRPEEVRMIFTSMRLLIEDASRHRSQVSWGDVEAQYVRPNGRVTLEYRNGVVEAFDFPASLVEETARILSLLCAGGESTKHAGRAWLCVRCHAPLDPTPAECASCQREYITPRAVLQKSWLPAGGLFLLGHTVTGITIAIIELLTIYGAWNVFVNALDLTGDRATRILWLGGALVLLEQIVVTIAAYGLAKRVPYPRPEPEPQIVALKTEPRLPIRNVPPPQPAATRSAAPPPTAPKPVVPQPAPPRPAPQSAPSQPSPATSARAGIRAVNPHDHVVAGTTGWTFIGVFLVILFFGFLLFGTWGIGLALMLLSLWTVERKVTGILLGGALRVGPYQFPEIHQRVTALTAAMGIDRAPEVYVLESNTQNAFAMKHGKKSRIVLIDDLVFGSALTGNENVLTWILAHEMAHVALGHTDFFRGWMRGVVPPLSRLDELTCDRVATHAVNDPDAVRDALTLLLVGPQLFARVNHRALQQQANELMTAKKSARKAGEKYASHPLLLHRYAKLAEILPPQRIARPAAPSPSATLTT